MGHIVFCHDVKSIGAYVTYATSHTLGTLHTKKLKFGMLNTQTSSFFSVLQLLLQGRKLLGHALGGVRCQKGRLKCFKTSYVNNHIPESIHIWIIGTLEAFIPGIDHRVYAQGCGYRSKSRTPVQWCVLLI